MSKHTVVIWCVVLLVSGSATAQTFDDIVGFQNSDRVLPSETENRIFQPPPRKLDKQDVQGAPDVDDSNGTERRQTNSDRNREGSSVTTSLGIVSTVFPFNTSSSLGANQTYLRLVNPESFSNEITVSVYSIDSADRFVFEGDCTISVPAKAAPQLGNEYFEECIGWSPSSLEQTMFLDFDVGQYVYWQNIIWSPTTGYFGNLSTCREPTVSDQFVHNVHTTKISNYPSTLFGLISVFEDYHVDVNMYDAGNGDLVGQYRSQLFPQNTVLLALQMSVVEQFTTWFIPFESRPFQVNLEFNLVNRFGVPLTQGLADLVSHYVQQTSRDETYNMLNTCAY
ncbi:MAG: hypothetical protein RIF37_01620 [Rhodospirillaceae bacterium]